MQRKAVFAVPTDNSIFALQNLRCDHLMCIR